MSYTLKLTVKARNSYAQNLDYLHKEWGSKVTLDFIDRVDTVLQTIIQNPYLYPTYLSSKSIHKCAVHNRIILYYRIKGNVIEILRFWNTYQDPKKLKF